jgi:hypothetical protein
LPEHGLVFSLADGSTFNGQDLGYFNKFLWDKSAAFYVVSLYAASFRNETPALKGKFIVRGIL